MSMNIGHSSRLGYDDQTYLDKVYESTSPLSYRLSTDQSYNCNSCLSTFGPRSSNNGRGYDVSRAQPTRFAPAQELADVESILSNRNVINSRNKSGKVNPINPSHFKLANSRICNKTLDPEYSRLSYPAQNYRAISINRFYNLHTNPQIPIFYDFAVNTQLESKDNYIPNIPNLWEDKVQPTPQ